jgi:hypothetical protein
MPILHVGLPPAAAIKTEQDRIFEEQEAERVRRQTDVDLQLAKNVGLYVKGKLQGAWAAATDAQESDRARHYWHRCMECRCTQPPSTMHDIACLQASNRSGQACVGPH